MAAFRLVSLGRATARLLAGTSLLGCVDGVLAGTGRASSSRPAVAAFRLVSLGRGTARLLAGTSLLAGAPPLAAGAPPLADASGLSAGDPTITVLMRLACWSLPGDPPELELGGLWPAGWARRSTLVELVSSSGTSGMYSCVISTRMSSGPTLNGSEK